MSGHRCINPTSASKNHFSINQYITETYIINTDLSVSHLWGSLQNKARFNKLSLKYICEFVMKILVACWCLTHSWRAATLRALVWTYYCLTPFIKARTTNILAKNSFQNRNKVQIVGTFNSLATKYSRKMPTCTREVLLNKFMPNS